MNRIYKVIWNEALNCFTAVGEYAKGRGKSSKSSVSSNNTTSNLSSINTFGLSAIGLGLLAAGFGMHANATGTYFTGDDSTPKVYVNPHGTLKVQGGETVAGDDHTKNINVTANSRDDSLTIKLDKTVDLGADGSLKIGDTLVDSSGIKITANNVVNDVKLTSHGLNNGNNKIINVDDGAITATSKEAVNGSQLNSLTNTVAANKTKYYSVNSTASGNANNDGATGPNAMAMGGNATAAGEQAIAIGSGESGQHTTASGQQSIAIGANVVSKGHSSIALGGDDLNYASKANIGGNSASTVLNGGTINTVFKGYAGKDMVEANQFDVNTESGGAASIAIGVKSQSKGDLSTAVGVHANSTGTASSAFGMAASATQKGALAMGAGAQSSTQDGVALGSKSVANVVGGATGFVPMGALLVDKNAIISTNSVALGAVSVGTGAQGGNRQIVNVAAGTNSSDAVNVAQLTGLQNGINSTLNQGIDFGGDSGNKVNRKFGEKLLIKGGETDSAQLASGNNIGVVADGADTLTVKLAKNLTGLTSVTTGDTVMNMGGISFLGGSTVSLSSTGLDNGGKQITNMASGGTTATNAANIGDISSAVAANKTQYYSVNSTGGSNDDNLGATGQNAMAMGRNASATGGQAIAIGSGGSGQHTTASGQQSIAIGANVVSKGASSIAIGGDDLDAASKANIDGTSASAINGGDVNTTFKAYTGRDLVETPPYMVNTESGGAASIAMGAKALSKGALSTAIGIQSSSAGVASSAFGMGSSASLEGSVALGAGSTTATNAISESTMTVGGTTYTIAGPATRAGDQVSVGSAGAERQIKHVAGGTINSSSTDAVNGSQLHATNTAVNKNTTTIGSGLNFEGDTGDTVNRQLGQTLAVKGGATNLSDNNIGVVADGTHTLSVKLAKDLTGLDSVSTGNSLLNTNGLTIANGPKFTTAGINANNQQIQGVMSGGTTETNAANIGDLNTAITGVSTLGFGLKAADGHTVQKPLGQAVEVVGSNNNIDTRVKNGKIEVELSDNLDLGNNGSVSTGNFVNGTNVNRLGIVTGGLLTGGVTTISGSGVTAAGLNPFNPTSATLTSDGLTILNGPSITKSGGINAGNKKITNVKAGTTTLDAVNFGQLAVVSNVADSAMQTVITQIDGTEVKTLNKTNNTANFLTGDNIVLTAEDGGIKVATAEDVMFTSVTTGDTFLNNDGVSFLGGSSVRLSQSGLNNGGNRITEVGDATELDDAVNLSQLNGVTETANKGWDISAQGNSATASNVGPGESVDFNSKNSNIIVSKDTTSNDISFKLNDNLDLGHNGSVKMGSGSPFGLGNISTLDRSGFTTGNVLLNTTINGLGVRTGNGVINTTVSSLGVAVSNPFSTTTLSSTGLNIIGGPSMTTAGINAGNKKIINVDDGVLAKDAVNVSQLTSASATAKTEVVAGTNVAGVVKSTGGNGQDIYTINANGSKTSVGSPALEVSSNTDTNNLTDYTIDLSETSKASLVKADSAMQSVITQIDGTEVKTLNKMNNTANFLTGDNIVLTAEEGGIKVATADDVSFTSVTTGDTFLNNDGVSFLGGSSVRLSNSGLNNGGNRITNVADGDADTDAVNVRQLNATNSTVDLGLDFTGDDTAVVVNRKLGQTLTIQGGATDLTENNIGVVADEEGNLNVRLAEDIVLGRNGSVRMENTVLNNAGITITDGPNQTITLSNEGLDNGNNRIIKVAEGIAPSDAVNFAQLTTTNNEIAKGIKIGDGNSDNDQQFALGDTINITGDSNLTTVASTTGVQVKLNNQLNLGDDGSMQIGNSIMNNTGFTFVDNGVDRTVRLSSTGLDNGGNAIRNVGRGELDSDAVNVGQLKDVAIALDQGWGITAQGDIATMVKQGSTVDLSSRDGNIKVSRKSVNDAATRGGNPSLQAAAIPTNANDINFDLNPDITLDSVTTGDTTINDNGLTIAGGPSITKNGINAANNKITNVQNGEVTANSQEAINGSQLYTQGSGVSNIIGGATVYNPVDGTFTNSNIGGTGQSNIDGAIASIRQGTVAINANVQTNTTNIATNTTKIATNTTNIATNVTNIKANKDRLDSGLNFGADSGANINKPIGDNSVLSFTGGNNITTSAEGSSIKFDLNGNINVDSVTTGKTTINNNGVTIADGPSMTVSGINAASNKITNVTDGVAPRDAVNFGQLDAVSRRLGDNMNQLGYKINEVEDDVNAGISAAMAMSSLPQAYIAGKSLIGGGIGTYNGESAVAIGFSKLSNDGRWVMKLNGTADTQGNAGASIGAGFHFD